MLEEMLMLLGAKKPFKNDGSLTIAGTKSMEKVAEIIDCLENIGALGLTGDALMNYLDNIVEQD